MGSIHVTKWKETVNSKWVFKKKINVVGQVEKYKDQQVVKGYYQVEGVKIHDIFFRIYKLTSITLLMSLAIEFDLNVE